MKSYTFSPVLRSRYQPFRPGFVAPTYRPSVPLNTGADFKSTRPSANIIRNEGAYEIQLAVPGLTKDKIRLEVTEDQLIVSAISQSETSEKPNFLRQEFDYEGFKRVFRLHKNANTAALKASFDQGVLKIVIPDKEPETIKIDIQ